MSEGEPKYYCRNCGAKVKSTDTECPKCGINLKEVGRRIELALVETIKLSDNVGLANRITGSLVNVSGGVTFTSSLVNAIPKEKREEIGIREELLSTLKNIDQTLKEKMSQTPFVKIEKSVITAPINISQQGDNIVITTNIEDSFNRIYQEIEKMNVDLSTKVQAKSKIKELKEEIEKEKPDISKIRKIWAELKSLVPLLASSAQLLTIISKFLLG